MTKSPTPMMCQYDEIKKGCKDAILFFRMGDFYEMFRDDALVASDILGIVLTSRNKESDVPFCGIPYHAADAYIAKLVRAGYSIAICEQIGNPKTTKGIVERKVVRTITPGTVVSHNLLEEKENNFLVSVFVNGNDHQVGMAYLDISTGEFSASEFPDSSGWHNLETELFRIKPGEILLPASLERKDGIKKLMKDNSWKYCFVKDDLFCLETSQTCLKDFFNVSSLDDLGCKGVANAVRAAGCIIKYGQKTQQSDLGHITTLNFFSPSDYMVLDGNTQKTLEIVVSTLENTKKGSLLWVLDKTKTSMGGRKLKKWLLHPLRDITGINLRLDGVEELKNKHSTRESMQNVLGDIKDIERILGRVALEQATPRDIFTLGKSLLGLPALENILSDLHSRIYKDIKEKWTNCEHIYKLIGEFIEEEPPITAREGGIIKPGVDSRIDKFRAVQSTGNAWIAEFEKKERERTGIGSLKVKFNKVFGYFIEITRSNLERVPDDYIRRQTTANGERYITSSLKEMESEIVGASEKVKELEYEIFVEIRGKIAEQKEDILRATQNISVLDIMNSLAEVAFENGYTRPVMKVENVLSISGGWHPVLEQVMVDNHFVPNDTLLDGEENRLAIITGPNMAGKSTYMRQVALIALMAHVGSFVPVRSASIGILDRIFTRVGASDNILKGRSTFMVEMVETAHILKNATDRSLVVIDEIGRGTSTFDGLSIAWAVAECLCRRLRAKTLFATHYHELIELPSIMKGVKNYNVEVRDCGGEIAFLYRVIPGGASESYGIAVAELAGIPHHVIKRSEEVLEDLEKKEHGTKIPQIKNVVSKVGFSDTDKSQLTDFPRQLSLFKTVVPPHNPLFQEIKSINVDRLTPIKALNKIVQWKEKAAKL